MKNLITIPFSSPNAVIERKNNLLIFHAAGRQLDGTFYEFVSQPVVLQEYLVIDYTILGIRRQLLRRGTIAWGLRGAEKIPLICYDDLSMDNRCHSLAVRVPSGAYDGLLFCFAIDRRTKADWTVHSLYTCAESELPVACSRMMEARPAPYRTLDLSPWYNKTYAAGDPDCQIDGGRFFDTPEICLEGIPFHVVTEGNNVITPPPGPAENGDTILNFGVPAIRRLCRPVSRDSLITIPVHGTAKEIFFLRALEGKRYHRWNFATDGTILGAPDGEVTMPLTVYDVEGYVVEIVYADGRHDTAMPMHIGLRRHVVQGDLSAYVVPADGSEIAEVIFHNRLIDTDCNLIAVTINETETRKFPQLLNPTMPEKIKHTISKGRSISISDGILCVQNGALYMKADVSKAMTLLELRNDYVPEMTVEPAPMLQILDKARNAYDGIVLRHASCANEMAELLYSCAMTQPACTTVELRLLIALGEKNDIRFDLSVKNIGAEDTRIAVVFPAVSGLSCGSWTDSWYFLPKYQEHVSNETIWMYEESAPSFPMQYMDVFSPSQQGGLALTTREQDVVVRKYALEKDEKAISFFVEYPHMYGQIPVGETRQCSPTLLTAHEGDWRAAFTIYKTWLDSWYTPYKCQNKQWYKECFWLLAEITDFFETKEFTKFPIWYDKKADHFNFMDVMEEQRRLTGYYPDILHLWAWTYREDLGVPQWGNFGDADYELYGGLEHFRTALQEVREKTGKQISLYLHPTLLSERYPQAKTFFPTLRVINDQGQMISINSDSFRMCHANEKWRDFAVSMYPKIYRDLGIPILYVDEFSLRIENRCYAEGHGHCVPSNLLKTDRDFIVQLKNAMPEEVVLYGEYAPVDINARYIDCNISYSYLDAIVDIIETAWRADDGDDCLSRIYVDTYRFAFPGLVQLVLPMAMRNLSWHPQKFFFFNGTAIYDSFWDIEESAGHEFTIHAYGLKKKYADCFTSDHPETMIDTLTPVICANRYPGRGRTLYTLYNRGYNTFRGKFLRVAHKEGNSYYDAWNETKLVAEICDGYAELFISMDAMQMGCVVVSEMN